MNRYSANGSAIIDATGKQWPVDVAHPLPLPEGIDDWTELPNSRLCALAFTGPIGSWHSDLRETSTHWLARRPLPEIPKPKTQEELDEEWIKARWHGLIGRNGTTLGEDARDGMRAAIAYARGQQ